MKKGMIIAFLFGSTNILAAGSSGWGVSAGYNNPIFANIGINFIHWWPSVALEFGIGGFDGSHENDLSGYILGDIDLKLYLEAGNFKPYFEGGLTAHIGGVIGDKTGVSFNTGEAFVGAGASYDFSKVFIYACANYGIESEKVIFSGGVGIKL